MNDKQDPEEPLIPTRYHRAVIIGMTVYILLILVTWFVWRLQWLIRLNTGICVAVGLILFWLNYRRDAERKNISGS